VFDLACWLGSNLDHAKAAITDYIRNQRVALRELRL